MGKRVNKVADRLESLPRKREKKHVGNETSYIGPYLTSWGQRDAAGKRGGGRKNWTRNQKLGKALAQASWVSCALEGKDRIGPSPPFSRKKRNKKPRPKGGRRIA